ncbi:MAG: PadR family transcriptional regulator [Desulfobacteraceae bacterium]|nr:MAG: PadR family transcriptional regulator [Desulfobacteraceae bacterium]
MTSKNEAWIGNWESQVRKGMLDFIILLCLQKREFYGYELIKVIKTASELDISEGTIYPLLNRLKKEDLISSRWEEKESGIPRKYYAITAKGQSALAEIKKSWLRFNISLESLMEGKI